MATQTTTTTKPEAKVKKAPPALHERVKTQLTGAALRGKLTMADLEMLEGHIGKLKALLA